MLRFILVLLVGLGAAAVLSIANAVRRPLARLIRALLVGLTMLFAVAALAIGAAGLQGDEWWAVAVAGGMLLLAFRFGWALRLPNPSRAARIPDHVPLTQLPPDARWRRFESGLDWVSRQQAKRSRARIGAFLAERHSPSLTHEHRALLLSCERRVPQLIDTCIERCRNASAQERERYVEETLERLVHIGGEADSARREIRRADDQRLQVLHRYFDNVAGRGDEQRDAR
jgi:hypothetical protein